LKSDANIECWVGQHLKWSLGLGIPSLFLCRFTIFLLLTLSVLVLVVPFGLLVVYSKKKVEQHSQSLIDRLDFLFGSSKEKLLYW